MREIHTERLVLRELPVSLIKSLLHSAEHALCPLEMQPAAQWPTKDTRDILALLAKIVAPEAINTGFNTFWLLSKQEGKIVIGDAGFKGEPSPCGEVEIGYGIVPDERQMGYGFEAVQALVSWALEQATVRVVRAECHKANLGSIRILEKCGMVFEKEVDEMMFWSKQKTNG